jgi:UDP-N-acetylmuramoylalanine--D-glutamate ligase
MELGGRNVLVIGLGLSGLSMARWLNRRGANVRVIDTRAAPPCALQLAAEMPHVPVATGAFRRESFEGIDLMAVSPGVPMSEPSIAQAQRRGVEAVGDIELFAQALPGRSKVLAITGSNGKSTVTEMTGAMCRHARMQTVVAGNIGLPALDALLEVESSATAPDVFVLELSSFQLETTRSLAADAAACLNVSEDHLDRYRDMDAYAAAKARIFTGQGVQVLNREDARCRAMAQPGREVVTFGVGEPCTEREWGLIEAHGTTWLANGAELLLPIGELRVAGLHNAANALAACALSRTIDLPNASLLRALTEFEGLPHRVQRIAEIDGIVFYDDSKGTNVGATVAALKGMQQKVVLIAGGEGKGQDFSPLKAAVAARARAVVLIGRDSDKIAQALKGSGVPVNRAQDMDQAVKQSLSLARRGDVVMLSPACASFDMFRNYEHRAQVFVAAVLHLEQSR